jgi:hypothetical protein
MRGNDGEILGIEGDESQEVHGPANQLLSFNS